MIRYFDPSKKKYVIKHTPKRSVPVRDYSNPAYKKARKECFKRDGYKCKMCGSGKKLNAHHILSWAENHALRFNTANLITLCKECHKMVTGKEDYYVKYFHTLLLNDLKKKAEEKKDEDNL